MNYYISGQQPFNQPENVPVRYKAKDYYQLTENYTYEWEFKGERFRITVFAGFLWDGASVPQFCWSLGFSPDGLYRAAALLHDVMCQTEGVLNKLNSPCVYQRFDPLMEQWRLSYEPWTDVDAARMFHRVMEEAGVPFIKRRAMLYAVRCFGPRFDGVPK